MSKQNRMAKPPQNPEPGEAAFPDMFYKAAVENLRLLAGIMAVAVAVSLVFFLTLHSNFATSVVIYPPHELNMDRFLFSALGDENENKEWGKTGLWSDLPRLARSSLIQEQVLGILNRPGNESDMPPKGERNYFNNISRSTALQALAGATSISADPGGAVQITVRLRDRDLARKTALAYVEALQKYMERQRQKELEGFLGQVQLAGQKLNDNALMRASRKADLIALLGDWQGLLLFLKDLPAGEINGLLEDAGRMEKALLGSIWFKISPLFCGLLVALAMIAKAVIPALRTPVRKHRTGIGRIELYRAPETAGIAAASQAKLPVRTRRRKAVAS